MFSSYASKPFPFSYHHATLRERVRAARYMSEAEATAVILGYTDIPQGDAPLFRQAVGIVTEDARDIKEATEGSYLDLVWDGFTVEETLAQRVVETINEGLCEAMVS